MIKNERGSIEIKGNSTELFFETTTLVLAVLNAVGKKDKESKEAFAEGLIDMINDLMSGKLNFNDMVKTEVSKTFNDADDYLMSEMLGDYLTNNEEE